MIGYGTELILALLLLNLFELNMVRTPVQSSNLASVGYDPLTDVLEVQFHNGSIYDYQAISQMVYTGLMDAPSKGHYLYEVIKRGGYAYQKVWDPITQMGSPDGALEGSESMLSPWTAGAAAAVPSIAPATVTPVGEAGALPDIAGTIGAITDTLGELPSLL